MKIAVVTEDGEKISSHFGRAPYYLVFTVEDGEIIAKEQREKAGHQQFIHLDDVGHGHSDDHGHDHEHGHGKHSGVKHVAMVEAIHDCDVLIGRGMGRGAYLAIQQADIRPILTELHEPELAVKAYVDGTLIDRPERVH